MRNKIKWNWNFINVIFLKYIPNEKISMNEQENSMNSFKVFASGLELVLLFFYNVSPLLREILLQNCHLKEVQNELLRSLGPRWSFNFVVVVYSYVLLKCVVGTSHHLLAPLAILIREYVKFIERKVEKWTTKWTTVGGTDHKAYFFLQYLY